MCDIDGDTLSIYNIYRQKVLSNYYYKYGSYFRWYFINIE